jgi:hypothetical protein
MNPKYLALYLVAGTLSLLLIIYELISDYPVFSAVRILGNVILCLAFYYLAYKTYHEKKDKELM